MNKTLGFEHNGRDYEVRVEQNHKSYVCHVLGRRQAGEFSTVHSIPG